jgi:hypothetical protein
LDLAVLAALDASGAADRSKRTASITLRAGTQPPQALLAFIPNLGPWARWEGAVWVGQDQPVQARLPVQAAPQNDLLDVHGGLRCSAPADWRDARHREV